MKQELNKWEKMYALLVDYSNKHEKLPEIGYITEDEEKLGEWVVSQKRACKRNELSDSQLELLFDISDEFYQLYLDKIITNEDSAKFLKDILDSHSVNYVSLAKRLNKIAGNKEDNSNLSNKINRGAFSLTFALQVIDVLGLELTTVFRTFEDNKVTISKDEFAEKYAQTSRLLEEAEEYDSVLKLLDNAREELLNAAGFTPETIEAFYEVDFDEYRLSKDKEKAEIVYDKLNRLNAVAIETHKLISDLKNVR